MGQDWKWPASLLLDSIWLELSHLATTNCKGLGKSNIHKGRREADLVKPPELSTRVYKAFL